MLFLPVGRVVVASDEEGDSGPPCPPSLKVYCFVSVLVVAHGSTGDGHKSNFDESQRA